MNREELLELHKRNTDRPQFYRAHHDALEEHLSETTASKMPSPDASTFAWREWLEDHRGVITRQLNDTVEGTDPQDTADETEVEAE
jgi:hypothetical protein